MERRHLHYFRRRGRGGECFTRRVETSRLEAGHQPTRQFAKRGID